MTQLKATLRNYQFLSLSKTFPKFYRPLSFSYLFYKFIYLFLLIYLSLPRAREHNICPSPEENKFIPHNSFSHFKYPFKYYFSMYVWVFQAVFFLQDSPPNPVHISLLSHTCHMSCRSHSLWCYNWLRWYSG